MVKVVVIACLPTAQRSVTIDLRYGVLALIARFLFYVDLGHQGSGHRFLSDLLYSDAEGLKNVEFLCYDKSTEPGDFHLA